MSSHPIYTTSGDATRLRRAAHTLKGGAGSLAANSTVAAAQRLETMGQSGNLEEALTAFSEVESEINRLTPALAAFVREVT